MIDNLSIVVYTFTIAQSAGVVENTDSTSAEG